MHENASFGKGAVRDRTSRTGASKRLVAALVAGLLTLQVSVAAAAGDEEAAPSPAAVVCPPEVPVDLEPFLDVDPASVHAEAIACAQARGWTLGRQLTGYHPLDSMTRAMAARILARLAGELTPPPTATQRRFPDVDAPADLVAAVGLLGGLGVLEGFEDGTFRPNERITRAQFATILDRMLRLGAGVELPRAASPFADLDGPPHGSAVGALHAAGIVVGVTADRFEPRAPVRRDQFASLVVRAAELLVAAGRLAPLAPPGDPVPGDPDPVDPDPVDPQPLDGVRLDQIQVLGSHNSYKLPSPVLNIIRLVDPQQASELDYGHVPIPEQLERQAIRQLELDVFADPEGGRYSEPLGLDFVNQSYPPEVREVMDAPGFKVLHAQDVDFASSCLTLIICLEQVRGWSDANPDHLPVVIMIEGKDEILPPVEFAGATLEFVEPLPFTSELLAQLDDDIRSVFDEDRLITPDDVRGDHETLESAVLAGGWPELNAVRGQVLFFLDNRSYVRDLYREGTPNLEGRAMFTTSQPGQPDAAVLQLPDPVSQEAQIAEAVQAGYLVRTRSDTPTVEARSGDTTRRDAAFRSGAQFVSTDYADRSPFSDYQVTLPGGGPARCNPVLTVPACDDEALRGG